MDAVKNKKYLPEEHEDWSLAEQYWNCIRPNTWENEACSSGGKLLQEKQVKDKWSRVKADPEPLRYRPSDVVNTLTRLDGEANELLKQKELLKKQIKGKKAKVEPQATREAWPDKLNDEQKLQKTQAAQQKYQKAKAFTSARMTKLSSLATSYHINLMSTEVDRMNAMDIDHLKNIILPAIEYACACAHAAPAASSALRSLAAKTIEAQAPRAFLQMPEEVPLTPSAVAWPAPAGNVTSFLQPSHGMLRGSWTKLKHGSAKRQNLAEDVMVAAADERDQEGSEDENAAIEVN